MSDTREIAQIAPGVTFSFEGRCAIVTGGSGGIGGAVVEALVASGGQVVIADANAEAAQSLAERLDPAGERVLAVQCDITDDDSVRELMSRAAAFGGKIDILINSAGVTSTHIIEETPSEEWDRVIGVNLSGVYRTCREVIPYFLQHNYGRIVNVASVAAKRLSYNGSGVYTTSKAGLLGFTKHLAYEVAPVGVRVNAVCPGPVMTPMLQSTSDERIISARKATIPTGKIATPEDQAKLIIMYASDLVDFVTGTALDVDGGALLGWFSVEEYFDRRKAERPWDGIRPAGEDD